LSWKELPRGRISSQNDEFLPEWGKQKLFSRSFYCGFVLRFFPNPMKKLLKQGKLDCQINIKISRQTLFTVKAGLAVNPLKPFPIRFVTLQNPGTPPSK